MNFDKLTAKSIGVLAKSVIAGMPDSYFTTDYNANRYMLTGDSKFTSQTGEMFTCGFASSVLTPDDVTKKNYYIAGYDSDNPAKGVLDDMYARSVYIDDNTGRGGIIMCSVDAVGISRHDINLIRKKVIESKKIPALRSVNISATHTHSAIDTQGLWGEKIYKCGRDEEFMASLREKTADAIIRSYENRADGKMYYAVKQTEDLQFDCRTPLTYDSNVTKLRFESSDGKNNIVIVNFASHAELLGSDTKSISADFPAYMIKEIEEKNADCNAVFINGAIGGMISAKEIKKVYGNKIDCEAYTKDFGRNLGATVNTMTDEKELPCCINIRSVPLKIKASNFVLILARFLKVLNNDIARGDKRNEAFIHSELGYLELGCGEIGIFMIPGELFPELYNGEFLTEYMSATGRRAQYTVLKDISDAKHTFVWGLCNDELGYIIPDNDFWLNEKIPYIDPTKDRFGRNHYEETNSTGPETARTILEKMNDLIRGVR